MTSTLAMLTLHHGNRLERLARRVAALLAEPVGATLSPEVVVVPNAGMARWLAIRIADANDLCAAVRFRLPPAFLWETFRALLPDLPEASPFQVEVMAWRLSSLIARLPAADPRFAPLRAYLAGAADPDDADRRRFELARRLARLYDQYLVYRPDWILDWEAGRDDHWQAALWRRLVAEAGGGHRGRLLRQVADVVASGGPALARLPRRIVVFGLPALPPADLWLLGLLARSAPVHVFLLNPCREHPGAVKTPKQVAWVAQDRDPDAVHVEVGHPLFASLGQQGREFFELVLERSDDQVEYFESPAGETLLARLQADVLLLHDRPSDGLPRLPLAADDRSLELHACHSPMREVEVLHDRLLDLFAGNPGLQPSDVVVMTPDVEAYAPCIDAVFGSGPRERQIRFTVADRSLRAEEPVIEAFFALLEVAGGRLEVDRLLGLLEGAAIRRRFGLADDDLERVHGWVRQAGVRWGADAAARGALGVPATDEHTWRFGLDRLLLGYAMPGGGRRLVEGLLPCDEVEGVEARALGALVRFARAIAALADELRERRPLAAWAERLRRMLDELFRLDEAEETAIRALRRALDAMADTAARAAHLDPVGIDVVAAHLRDALDRGDRPGRFFAGGVTVCAMVPMRAVPFEVVCLLGLDIAGFPRSRRPESWDRMADRPRFGDRACRDDDRTLFLDAILSARRWLHLSWVGRGVRDDQPIQPSVLVTELLEHVERAFQPPPGVASVRAHLVLEHPLQPFSRVYFTPGGDPRLSSFSEALCEASRAMHGAGAVASTPLLRTRLPDLDAAARTVPIDGLVAFYAHPARHLLRERLGLRLESDERPLTSREPFALDGLERWQLADQLLAMHLGATSPAASLEALLRARGALPHGPIGRAVLRERDAEAILFAARVVEYLGGAPPRTIGDIDLPLGAFRLTGTLRDVGPRGIVGWHIASVKAKHRLALWIRHLVYVALEPRREARSVWLGRECHVQVGPVDDPAARLAELMALYWEGCHRLVPFAPASSLAWAAAGDPVRARRAAARAWSDVEFQPESDDPWFRAAWRSASPLDDDEFGAMASAVYRPMLAAERAGA